MANQRPRRSAGTTVLLDAVRRPPRYPAFPPEPQESLADIRALQAGEARRVACFARGKSGPWPRRYKRGTLQVQGQVASWSRPLGRRIVIDVRGMSAIGARPADHREQRFGSPVNIHIFALVRTTSPAGRLDLVVPAADVPLVTWFFNGQPEATDAALLTSTVAPGPGRRPVNRNRAWAFFAAGCGLMAGTPLAAALTPGWWMPIPFVLGSMLLSNGVANIVRAHRGSKQHE